MEHLDTSSRLPQQTLTENCGLCPLGQPFNTMSPRPWYTSLASGILIDPAVWPQQTGTENWRGCAPLERAAGPNLNKCGQGWGLSSYQVASWTIQPFGQNRHGPKMGGRLCPIGRVNWVPI